MKKLQSVIYHIADLVSYISFIGIVAMMLLISVDVFLRKAFDSPINGSYEIVQYMLMVVVFASFGFTQVKKMHVRVTMFIGFFPWRVHTIISGLWELLCAAVCGVVGYAAVVQAQYLFDKEWTSDVLRFPIYPFYYLEGILMFVFTLVLLCDSIRYFSYAVNKDKAMESFKEYS